MSKNSNNMKDIKINLESVKSSAVWMVNVFFKKYHTEDVTDMMDSFSQEYDNLLQQHEQEDVNDLSRLYRLISEFKPALASVLQPGKEFNGMCNVMVDMFNVTLAGVKRRLENKIRRPKDGPVLPGTDKSMDIMYFCTVCEQSFEIPEDMKEKLLNSSEKMEVPKHHEKEMEIRIIDSKRVSADGKIKTDIEEIKSASEIMGHSMTKVNEVTSDMKNLADIFSDHPILDEDDIGEYLQVLSVGIDVGSSTSHLVFSSLTLRRERSFFNMSNRFHLINRKLVYEGTIIDTPLIDRYTIDIDAVVKFFEEEYKKAGINTEMVDTGAVIVTGETAKKQNAAEIVR
ncbi:MAG: ethanolamine ammonia-lyase reactivating factor EutA, partial [Candidatus Heimdallarchaeaceae archaeon]